MNHSVRRGVVIPELPYRNVGEAVDWLCRTFGLTKRLRIGDHRAQLSFGQGSVIVIGQGGNPRAAALLVRMNDIDNHYEHAKQAGARIISPPADYPYGERQ